MADSQDNRRDDRYERWLDDLRRHLTGMGWDCTLGYDDYYLGNIMYLTLPSTVGYNELIVIRGARSRATAVLLSEEPEAADILSAAVAGHHRDINRLRNARRKFLHLIERMAVRLAHSFDRRADGYPQQTLARLRELVPEAKAMVGVAAHRHIKTRKGADETRYGASIPLAALLAGSPGVESPEDQAAEPVRRALRYSRIRGVYEAYGTALAAMKRVHADSGVTEPVVVPGLDYDDLLRSSKRDSKDDEWELDGSTCDACEYLFDCADVATTPCESSIGDIGGCDTPDCDAFDLPDCDVPCDL